MAIWPGLSRGPPGPLDSGPRHPPRVSARNSREMGPGRSNVATSRERSRTVDSRPTAVGPLSRIRSIRPSRSFEDVAGQGRRDAGRSVGARGGDRPAGAGDQRRATGASGTRTPTVSRPAVTTSGIRRERGRTRVSGPGQNASARSRASSGQSTTHDRAMSRPSAWTIKGFAPAGPWPRRSGPRPPGWWRRRRGRRRSPWRRRPAPRAGGSPPPRRWRRGSVDRDRRRRSGSSRLTRRDAGASGAWGRPSTGRFRDAVARPVGLSREVGGLQGIVAGPRGGRRAGGAAGARAGPGRRRSAGAGRWCCRCSR